jgi:transposase
MRAKTTRLTEALSGFFTDHHAGILRLMLDDIDRLSRQIATLDATIETAIAPFAHQVTQLDEITAVGLTSAQELIAEIGPTGAASPPPPTRYQHGVVGQVLPTGPRVRRQEEGTRDGDEATRGWPPH